MDTKLTKKDFLSNKNIDSIFKKYYNDFIIYLNINKHNSRKTIYIDLKNLEAFDRYIYFSYPDIQVDKITEDIIYSYINFCANELNNNNKTINKKLSTLKKFFNYMSKDKYIYQYNIVTNISYLLNEKESSPTIITTTELSILFDIMRTYIYGYRDICICRIILETGLTLNDILNLKTTQFSFSKHILTICTNGNTISKKYNLSNKLIADLHQYMEIRRSLNKKDSEYMFLSLRGTVYKERSFQLFFEEAVKRTSMEHKYQPRHLRSTFLYNISKIVPSEKLRQISGQNRVVQYYELNNNPLRNIK